MSIAFIFPGQGSQSIGMGRSLAQAFPRARAVLDQADAALGGGLLRLLAEGPEEELRQTANTQPAILAVSIAAQTVFSEALEEKLGARVRAPGFVAAYAGHSLGEYSALVAAGSIELGDAVRVVRARGTFMQEAVPAGEGAMAAILQLAPNEVALACAEAASEEHRIVSPANYNSPEQTVIAGHAPAVERAMALCKARGARRAVPLPVSAPFHCALMEPVQPRLHAQLAQLRLAEPRAAVYANTTAAPNRDVHQIVPLLIEQVTAPVRWVESIEAMARAGVDTFIELGPGKVLSGLVRRIDKSLRAVSVEDAQSMREALELVA